MTENKVEYVIVHDVEGTDNYNGCLLYVCGTSREHAESVLHRILNNPSQDDLRNIAKGYINFRIEEVPASQCWWNDPFLAN
jgi:hypothetical protein